MSKQIVRSVVYRKAKELEPFAPLLSRVLCLAAARGTLPPGFFDKWLGKESDVPDAEFVRYINDAEDKILLAAAGDGGDVLALGSPLPQGFALNVDAARLRRTFGGVVA